jgi:hypothetical protein
VIGRSKERVVELDLGADPEPAVPLPVVVGTDTRLLLGYNATRPTGSGRTERAGVAIAEFHRGIIHRFGYPNDEALHVHPTSLRHYRWHEVLESAWLAEVNAWNRQAFPSFSGYPLRHFAVTFIDATFECLAADVSIEVLDIDYADLFTELMRRVKP